MTVTPKRARPRGGFTYLETVVAFVLLSLATTKRPIYLLPFFPAAAVAGGFWLEAFLQRRADRLYEKGIERLLPVFIFLASPALLCGAFACGVEATWAIAGALAGVGASAGTWISFRRGKRGAALLLWTSGLAVVLLATLHSIIPAVDEMKSLRSVSARVASTVPLDRPIHALKPDETTEGMIPLYTGRSVVPVPTPEKLEALFSEGGEIYLLTVDKDRYTPGTPEWEKSQYGSVEHLPHEVLFEDLGKGIETRLFSRTWTWYPSRVFRLLRLRAAN